MEGITRFPKSALRLLVRDAAAIDRSHEYLESQIGIAAHPSRRAQERAPQDEVGDIFTSSPDEVSPVETQQPHAEERATRASRSMGGKRLAYLTSSVLAHDADLQVFSASHCSISVGPMIRFGNTGLSVPALTSMPSAILPAANCLAADSLAKLWERRE